MNKEHVMEMLETLREASKIMNHLGTLMCDHFKDVTSISEVVDRICKEAYTLAYEKQHLNGMEHQKRK